MAEKNLFGFLKISGFVFIMFTLCGFYASVALPLMAEIRSHFYSLLKKSFEIENWNIAAQTRMIVTLFGTRHFHKTKTLKRRLAKNKMKKLFK